MASLLLPVEADAQSLVWARAMGGPDDDRASDVAVDGAGNVYSVGTFEGAADFDPGPGTQLLVATGLSGGFVSKLDSGGNFVWARALGSSADGVAVDGAGNVYAAHDSPASVSKLSPGGEVLWSRSVTTTSLLGFTDGADVAVDRDGNVFFVGGFKGTADFDPGPAAYPLTSRGQDDAFVSKLDAAGNFVWAASGGGIDGDRATGVAVDDVGNVYAVGDFFGVAHFGSFSLYSSWTGGFLAKLDESGTFRWAMSLDFEGRAEGVAVDGTGMILAAGATGHGDILVAKVDPAGALLWRRTMGGDGYDVATGVSADGAGGVYYTANSDSFRPDFDPGPGTFTLSYGVFVSKLDANGNFAWAVEARVSSDSLGRELSVDPAGNVHVVGEFNGEGDFDPGPGTYTLQDSGGYDAFVWKLGQDAEADLSVTIGATPDPVKSGQSLTYTTTVSNAGPSAAVAPTLVQTLPSQSQFVSLTAPPGASCTSPPTGQSGTVSCSFSAPLAAGATATLTTVVKITAPNKSSVTSTTSVSSAAPDPVAENNTASTTTRVRGG